MHNSIPSVVALAPIVMVPGEKIRAVADVTPLLPKSAAGELLESVVSLTSIAAVPAAVLDVDTHAEASFDSTSISLWIDASAAVHGQRFEITITFKSRTDGGPSNGTEDRIRKAICPVIIRSKDFN